MLSFFRRKTSEDLGVSSNSTRNNTPTKEVTPSPTLSQLGYRSVDDLRDTIYGKVNLRGGLVRVVIEGWFIFAHRFPPYHPGPGEAQHSGRLEGGLWGGNLRTGTNRRQCLRGPDRIQPNRTALLFGHTNWTVHPSEGPTQHPSQP